MAVLTVNTGSSSIRLAAYDAAPPAPPIAASRHAGEASDAEALLAAFLGAHAVNRIHAVAHRVVHGGSRLTVPCLIDREVEAEIRALEPLAPLHNPPALRFVAASRAVLGSGVAQVAVFDTGFYSRLPEVATAYALPLDLARKHGIRRYGFHGIAHEAMWRRWRELQPGVSGGGRVISLQLGAGCSVTAVDRGRAVDTSMGFSPLEGLVMATRCGDLDPGLALHLQRVEGWTPDQLEHVLNRESGLLGLSGSSADMAALLASRDDRARLAVETYCYRARKYIGAYFAALGGVDAILFGGGIGEHAPAVRARILSGLDALGIAIDSTINESAHGKEARISVPGSAVEIHVIVVDEAAMLAQAAFVLAAGEINTTARK